MQGNKNKVYTFQGENVKNIEYYALKSSKVPVGITGIRQSINSRHWLLQTYLAILASCV